MANICEKLVEEVSSGSTKLSAEMQSHVQTCAECQKTLQALDDLKAARKGLSVKEAAAISAITAKIMTDATVAASSSAVAKGSGIGIIAKTAIGAVAILALVVASHLLVPADQVKIITPVDAVNETKDHSAELKLPEKEKAVVGAESDKPADSVAETASQTASSANNLDWQNSPEKDKMGPDGNIMVSPDQEDIQPR